MQIRSRDLGRDVSGVYDESSIVLIFLCGEEYKSILAIL